MSQQRILDNFGRPPNVKRPIDLDFLFRDKDELLPVILLVTIAPSGNPRDNHWTIAWQVGSADGYAVQRRIHIVREINTPHLTNWGAITKSASAVTASSCEEIPLKTMTLAERKKMEAIGNATPVLEPDGSWNCQDWTITVFESAEKECLLSREEWSGAVGMAQQLG